MPRDSNTPQQSHCTVDTQESNFNSFETHPIVIPSPPRSHFGQEIQECWCGYCEELEEWVRCHLLNRDDVFGCYRSLDARSGGSKSYTAPVCNELRVPGALTSGRIKQHFWGHDRGNLIGIHAVSATSTSKWLAIDIDQHDVDAGNVAHSNLIAAGHWYSLLLKMGFRPLLLDSNGNGGLHLIVIFNESVPTPVVHHFGKCLISDFQNYGLTGSPEIFPKQAQLTESCRYGNWLRLPGLHHTRDHWTAVWSGERWLTGEAAILHLLGSIGDGALPLQNWWQNNHPVSEGHCDQAGDSLPRVQVRSQVTTNTRQVDNNGACHSSGEMRYRLCFKTRQFLNGDFKDGPEWNNRLFKAACDMFGNEYRYEDALPLLLQGASPHNDDEKTAATRTIENAFSKPRQPAKNYRINQEICTPRIDTRNEDISKVETGRQESLDCDNRALPVVNNASNSSTILQTLPGAVFPTSIPDFIPVPCEKSLPFLELSEIEPARGRPIFDYDEMIYWPLLMRIYQSGVSPIIIPDIILGACFHGANLPSRWKEKFNLRGQRRYPSELAKKKKSELEQEYRELEREWTRIKHISRRNGSVHRVRSRMEEISSLINIILEFQIIDEKCPEQCPFHASEKPHLHFQFNPSDNFLGIMAEFATETGDRQFQFDFDRMFENNTKLLDSLIKQNKTHWAYLPVQLFGKAAGLSKRQIRMLQGIVRETTRRKRYRRTSSNKPSPHFIEEGKVPGKRGSGELICPFLDRNKRYVSFGGNLKNHRARGYALIGDFDSTMTKLGGWLRRFGYPVPHDIDEIQLWKWISILLKDVSKLASEFGLVVAGLDDDCNWRSLDEINIMIKSMRDRRWLRKCSLRIFGPENYLELWRHRFASKLGFCFIQGGALSQPCNREQLDQVVPVTRQCIKSQLKLAKKTQKEFAKFLSLTESRVSRQLSGATQLSDDLVSGFEQFISQIATDEIAI